VTLWLAAAALAVLVAASGTRPPARRLERWRSRASGRDGTEPSIGGREVAMAAAFGSALVASGLPLVLVALGALSPAGLTRWRRARQRNRIREARRGAVAELTFALAGELRAGRTPSEALRAAASAAGPLADVLRAAAESVAVGGSAAAELESAGRLPGAERLVSVAAAWRVTETAGGRVALVLERLGEAMDRDDELQREMAAALAAPRATVVLLAGLPVFGLFLGQAMGAHVFHLLLYRPLGWALLLGAALLDALGIVATRRISRWALQP
jgi:tight adherence protein B